MTHRYTGCFFILTFYLGRNEPTLETLNMLTNYFNFSIDYLIERDTNNLIGYLTEDQTEIVRALLQPNKSNQIRVGAYISGLLAGQDE